MITGRSAPASSAAARGHLVGVGLDHRDVRARPARSASPVEKTTSSGRSRKTGPRCGVSAAVSAAADRARDRRRWRATVAACLVTGATSGTWSISCRLPAPQRNGGRPAAEHQHRRAVEVRAGQAGDAVGDAGAGGEHGEARAALQLGDRLGGEHRGLLVPHVVDREAGLVRGVVEREDVAAGEREHLADAVRPQRRQRQLAAVSLDPSSVMPVPSRSRRRKAGYRAG